MKIDDFISETIKGIASGINKANSELNQIDCYVNPPKMLIHGKEESAILTAEIKPAEDNPTRFVEKVKFDVSVVAEETKETGGKAGVSISILTLGTEASSASGSKSASRVAFSIPVVFPTAKPDDA